MAAVATVNATLSVGDTETLYIGTIALDSSYPTGGEVIDISGNENIVSLIANAPGYVCHFVPSSQKLVLYWDNTPAAAAVLGQVADTTNLSSVVVNFWAIGQ